jgi:Putative zinc-binding metallo-peptidase
MTLRSHTGRIRARQRRSQPAWATLRDEELLDLRFCDLHLKLKDSFVEPHLERLNAELHKRGLRFQPHAWLSEEWFSPDGIPGIAVPFYLAHPRLMQIERRFMHEVEGGNANWLMRILRHEAGHAVDTAFRLRRRKEWGRIFGRASRPYPDVYKPRPASRNFVLHLGHWYAQSHPTEDFAETFAVWLQPRSRWRRDYADWPVRAKLEYVDSLMGELKGARPAVRTREVLEPLADNRQTLRQHYEKRLQRYAFDTIDAYDLRLKRVFGKRSDHPRRVAASGFLRQVRPQLIRLLARRNRLHPYVVHHVMRLVIRRCRILKLVVTTPQREAKRAALGLIERIMLDVLRRDREKYAL